MRKCTCKKYAKFSASKMEICQAVLLIIFVATVQVSSTFLRNICALFDMWNTCMRRNKTQLK